MAKIDMRSVNRSICEHFGEHLIWETGEGEEIAVCKLADKHLDALVRMFEQLTSSASYNALYSLRGEMAIEAAEYAINDAESWLDALIAERNRRRA